MPGTPSRFKHRGIGQALAEVRKARAQPLFGPSREQPADGPPEPGLELDEIQGNSIAGFNKRHQTLLFYNIDEAADFKPVVGELAEMVATAEEVLAFNRLFKRTRARGGPLPKAAWINVAFSAAGLAKLTSDAEVALFADPSFRSGLTGRPEIFGDPGGWARKDGAEPDAADVLVIVAADTPEELETEVASVEELMQGAGVHLLGEREVGRALPGSRARDHFGWTDGISQPGVRGRVSALADDFITAREVPGDPDHGKPGQELVWPGEFVFGYPDQDGGRDPAWVGDWMKDGAGFSVAPDWAKNGSYLVFGRFRQNIRNFDRFLDANRRTLNNGTKEEAGAVGARVLGRWPSGAPVIRALERDDEDIGSNDLVNNYFGFVKPLPSIAGLSGTAIPAALADPAGKACPLNAHIRKANPRDQIPAPGDRLRHRLLRRGVPYGEPPEAAPVGAEAKDDGVDRGLLFVGYMTSIADQFEFVMKNWIRDPAFPLAGAGADSLLAGQDQDWIGFTGGGYYFAPSIQALNERLSK